MKNDIVNKCYCTGGNGIYKQTYDTEIQAMDKIEKSMLNGSPELVAYQCPHKYGWHITKK